MSESKKNCYCTAPLEVIADDPGACEYLRWTKEGPECDSPTYNMYCPDFSEYFRESEYY